ncbi:MAG TPA: hypothetical protein VK919_04830 [Solirubrobacterales bacterium]|nr:hypothetical protein [Solirubrobacterales bacterium]
MTTVEEPRNDFHEIAEAIAPTWARRREFIEDVSAPVREWLIDALDPQPGDTVLERDR